MISAPLSAFVFSSSFFGSLDPSPRTTSTPTPSSCAAAFFTASSRSPKPLRTTSSRCAIVSARGCVNPTRASSTEPVQCFSSTAVYTSLRFVASVSRVRARMSGKTAVEACSLVMRARRTSLWFRSCQLSAIQRIWEAK